MTLVQSARAAEFSQSYLRLDRLKANSALSGLVCAKPSSAGAGTEAKVLVTFPSDFTISSSTSNHTTSTSNLPSGATAWPSIGSSSNAVSGQTVTFSGGDLTNGSTLYCFNFTASSSITGSSGEKSGSITTKNSSDTTIDSSDYGLTIVTSDEITVSGTIPANASDYSAITAKLTEGTQFAENKEVEYKITYGTSLSYATAITLEASWSLGTIEGAGSPTVEVLTYVVGSASNAYGGAPPVIDTVNRTITWEIDNFPGNTADQTVTYKVKTTSNYTGSSRVSFINSGSVLFPGGSTADSEATTYYKYSSTTTTTSTSSSPTSTPTPGPSTSTSTPVTKPTIQLIEVREIFDESASIFIQTSTPTTKTIRFGTATRNLNRSITGGSALSNVMNLTGLQENTKYYFRVYATNSSSNQTVSDLYTFTTAEVSEPLLADPATFVATSHDIIISPLNRPYLVIPKNTVFHFKFAMRERISAKKVAGIVRNRNVLGLFSFTTKAQANSESTDLIEIEPGVYSGNLKTRPEPGNYEIYASITDTKNNIIEQKISDLKVINRFTVISKKTKQPLEGERVLLYIYAPSSRTYQIIPSASILAGNPAFTDRNGELDIVLPHGKYKAEVTSLRYKDQTVEFEIGPNEGQEFPTVELEGTGISAFHITRYYLRTINDIFIYNTKAYSEALTGSSRFFDLLSAISLGGLVALTLFSFSKKHHIPVSSMFTYFYYFLDQRKRNEKYIHGVVYDEGDKPIPGANVYLTDRQDEKIISNTKTDRHGEFFFRKGQSKYLLLAMAKNFKTSPLVEYHEKEHLKYKIILVKKHDGLNLFENAWRFTTGVFGMSFEGLAVLTIIFQFLFINSFGLVKTLPFLSISIFNLMLWTLYLRHRHLITHHS